MGRIKWKEQMTGWKCLTWETNWRCGKVIVMVIRHVFS
jgi:hypothetical protein